MDSRERIRAIIAGDSADRCGFWLGNPHADTWPIYALLGSRLIVSPSHEALLPNVPPENVLAVAEAAVELS